MKKVAKIIGIILLIILFEIAKPIIRLATRNALYQATGSNMYAPRTTVATPVPNYNIEKFLDRIVPNNYENKNYDSGNVNYGTSYQDLSWLQTITR